MTATAWKLWPMGEAALVDRLRALPPVERRHVYESLEREFGLAPFLDVDRDREGFWYRDAQVVTDEELRRKKLVLFVGDRGDGKTDAAMNLFDRLIREGRARMPRMFAANSGDIGDILINGPSGLLSLYDRDDPKRPRWYPNEGNHGVVRYPNGVRVVCFSAEVKKGAVGHGGDVDFYDDVTKWAGKETAWNHARTSCREGLGLGIVATSAGEGEQQLWDLIEGKAETATTLIKRLSGEKADPPVRPNLFNLSYRYYEQMLEELGDTDFYRREMLGENVSASSPFTGLDFDSAPIRVVAPSSSQIAKVAVAVDPADGKGGSHDEWGIGAAARLHDGHVVALDDASGSYDDDEAAAEAIRLCELWGATEIVVENNRGAKRVQNAIAAVYYRRELEVERSEGAMASIPMPKIIPIQAKDGKVLRAGPLRVMYLQGTLHHVQGLRELERQQREWKPDGPKRPRQDDRIDWWVHVVLHLADLARLGAGAARQLAGLAEATDKALQGGRKLAEGAPERPSPMSQLLGGRSRGSTLTLPKKRLF